MQFLSDLFLGVLRSVLITALIFVLAWFLVTKEFPPNWEHVGEVKKRFETFAASVEQVVQRQQNIVSEQDQINARLNKLEAELRELKQARAQ